MPFITGPGWEQSSAPIVPRKVHFNDDDLTDLVWPCVAPFDTPADGDHPILAIGRKANRPNNVTAVLVTYDADTDIGVFNMADKFVSVQYVANVSGYSGTTPNAWQNTVYPMDPVFVDDSLAIAALNTGCTLSFAQTGGIGANPLAGYVFWCQDEYDEEGVGGANTAQGINQPAAADTSEVLTLCVLQVNNYGEHTP